MCSRALAARLTSGQNTVRDLAVGLSKREMSLKEKCLEVKALKVCVCQIREAAL
jgi:hypothetical protein